MPAPTSSPPAPAPTTSTGPSPFEPTPPRIDGLETPASVQPGERIRVDWRTVSDAPITETRFRWGTHPGSRPNLSPKAFTAASGAFSFTDTLKVLERTGAIYVSVTAIDARGASVESQEVAIPIRWTAPDTALVFSASLASVIGDGETRAFELLVPATGAVASVDVRVDLEHPTRGDLTIELLSPDGRTVRLVDDPTIAEKDVLGTFGNDMLPVGDLGSLRNAPITGIWTLKVTDRGSPATGTLRMWALVITPRVEGARRVLALPNLVSIPPDDVSVIYVGGAKQLAFGARVQNAGPGPLQLRGAVDLATGHTLAWQQIMNKLLDPSTGRFLGWELNREVLVGDFVFAGHESHEHWHLAAVAKYTIVDAQFQPVEGVGAVSKVTRCLTDSRRYDFHAEGSPAQRTFLCGQARQGISVGWEDNYGAGTDGQYLGIASLPDGVYYIVTELMTRLEESEPDGDNTSATRVRLLGDSVEVLEKLDWRALAARRSEVESAR